jgi:E3 ubiquitin-protein ligase RGLG
MLTTHKTHPPSHSLSPPSPLPLAPSPSPQTPQDDLGEARLSLADGASSFAGKLAASEAAKQVAVDRVHALQAMLDSLGAETASLSRGGGGSASASEAAADGSASVSSIDDGPALNSGASSVLLMTPLRQSGLAAEGGAGGRKKGGGQGKWGAAAASAASAEAFEEHVRVNTTRYASLADLNAALAKANFTHSQLIFGIDCTKSNLWNGAVSFAGRSLHDLGGPADAPNPYVLTIRMLADELARFDADGSIPVYGFGDKTSADKSVFPFHTRPEGCAGFDDVLRTYAARIPTISLAGPTSFGPIIRKAVEHVKREQQNSFTILVILADGQVTAVRDTEHALVQASHFPISIVCVGVGDGPWDAMRVLDSGLPKRKFDNFRFVELNQVAAEAKERGVELEDAFVCSALAEVPSQYAEVCRLGILREEG